MSVGLTFLRIIIVDTSFSTQRMAWLNMFTKLTQTLLYSAQLTEMTILKSDAPLGLFVHVPRGVRFLFRAKRLQGSLPLEGSLQKIAVQRHQQVTISCHFQWDDALVTDLSIQHFVSTKVNDCTKPFQCFDRDENRLIRYVMNVDL